ncbi:MAG: homoserine dehydrogenase [Vampirovibrionales bacterium]|nr:homoserine dehydrogenase [Vampirovibrionales bacterium]
MMQPHVSESAFEPPCQQTSLKSSDSSESPDSSISSVGVALIGLGTVGSGVYKLLAQENVQGHLPVGIRGIAVRNPNKVRVLERNVEHASFSDPQALIHRDDVQIVVETMGGITDAYDCVKAALLAKKHVVTANKALIATHGSELFELARKHQVRLLFEGAVAGGIPVMMPLKLSLAANRIEAIAGILNGTTNYILTQMATAGLSFEEALEQAQSLGFAEADPTSDVEGEDAAFKLSILASMGFQQHVMPQAVHRHGITTVSALDIENAQTLDYTVKLIALAQKVEASETHPECLTLRVQPMLVPASHPLARIDNEYNAVWIRGHAVGDVMFSGKGAGELPTASAVTADILAIARDLAAGNDPIAGMKIPAMPEAVIQPIEQSASRYYVRVTTLDQPSVIGHLGLACGAAGVSLESVMQRGISPNATASIMLLTHRVTHAQMKQALENMRANGSIQQIDCVLAVLPC